MTLDQPELPPLHRPATPAPLRLDLPEAVAVGATSGRPQSVAGFVAAELGSIPAQWIEEATGRRRGGAAPAPAPAPATPLADPVAPVPGRRPQAWPLAPAAIIPPCPLPEGGLLFGPLRSGYVDGPSLLRELAGRGHSGALVAAGGGRAQAVILHRGAVLALVAAGPSGTRRLERLRLPVAGQDEEHELLVNAYRPEVAVALGRLVNLPARFRRLQASFVHLPELLEHLAAGRMTGGVRVTAAHDAGVLLIAGGEPVGAYTAAHPALEDVGLLARLCGEAGAEIDVHAAPMAGDPPAVEVARALA